MQFYHWLCWTSGLLASPPVVRMLGMIKTFTVYYQHPMGKDPWWFASSTYNSRHTGLSGQHQRSNQDSEISLRALTRGYACCQLLMWCAPDRCSCTTFESWWCWGFEKNKGVESVYCFNFYFAVFRLMHTSKHFIASFNTIKSNSVKHKVVQSNSMTSSA